MLHAFCTVALNTLVTTEPQRERERASQPHGMKSERAEECSEKTWSFGEVNAILESEVQSPEIKLGGKIWNLKFLVMKWVEFPHTIWNFAAHSSKTPKHDLSLRKTPPNNFKKPETAKRSVWVLSGLVSCLLCPLVMTTNKLLHTYWIMISSVRKNVISVQCTNLFDHSSNAI